jgi:hypothetical protein
MAMCVVRRGLIPVKLFLFLLLFLFHQFSRISHHFRWIRTELTVDYVLQAFVENPHNSTRRVATDEGSLSATSVWRILKDAKFHAFKMERRQELKPHHRIQRVQHAHAQLQILADNPDFLKTLLFSDEAHFSIHGEVNHHNFRYWSNENPGLIREEPLHSPRMTVWAAIGYGGVIVPVFVDGSINGGSYLALLQQEFLPKAEALQNFHSLIFMQDGAPPHWATAVREWLSVALPGRWMGRGSPTFPWPANSPDLTPCDFSCGAI